MADLDEIYVFSFVNIHLHMHTIYINQELSNLLN